MKKHNGIRPQDIALLLAIASLRGKTWQMKHLSEMTGISRGEVSESINRSVFAGLISLNKHDIHKGAFLDLLEYGVRYIFPVHPGNIAMGFPTAISASPLNQQIRSDISFVWPSNEGEASGFSIESLYESLPENAIHHQGFYELLALTDALRFGRIRERELAIQELKQRINGE